MLKPLKEQTESALLCILPIALPRIRSSSLFKTSYLSDNAEPDHQYGFENWSAATVRMFWGSRRGSGSQKGVCREKKTGLFQV